jgi:glucokinase
MEYCLITDIGGTNSRFFLYEVDRNDLQSPKKIHEARYSTKEYTDINQLFEKFLDEEPCRRNRPTYCNIAIAGAVKNNTVPKIANFNWAVVDGDAIAQKYNFNSCQLLNDFEAVGCSFITDPFKDSMIVIQSVTNSEQSPSKSEESPSDRWVVAGFGTGLGVVSIAGASKKETFRVLPCEGGHICIAPCNEEEWDLIRYLQHRMEIDEHGLFSQELLFCGRGIPYIFEYLKAKSTGKHKDYNLNSKQVFELIMKPEHSDIKDSFKQVLSRFIGRSFDTLCKIYLPTGGRLIVGGIIYHFFVEFFDSHKEKFLEALAHSMFSDPEFGEVINKKVEILLYSNDTDEFAVHGALNHLYLHQFMGKAKPKRSSLKDNYMKPITSAVEKLEKTAEKQPRTDRSEREKKPLDKKVSFDMPAKTVAFEDYYPSNILKANVLTFTGYLNHHSVKSKLFIGKIISDPVEKFYRRKSAHQEFRGYRLRLLDAEITFVIPLNIPKLFINDIVLINDFDTLYYSKDNGWYFQTFENALTDISVEIFDTLCEKFIDKMPLVDTEKISSKTKFQFSPSSLFPPKPETDLTTLLFMKPNGIIQSKVIMMKILDTLGSAIFRKDKETIIEFHHVKVQTDKYSFDAYIPNWTTIPQTAFYGFFFKETYLAPGFIESTIFVIDEYSIFDRSPFYDEQIPAEIEKHLMPSDLKVIKADHKNHNRH